MTNCSSMEQTEFKLVTLIQRRVQTKWNVDPLTSKSIHHWKRTLKETGTLASQTGKYPKVFVVEDTVCLSCPAPVFENVDKIAEIIEVNQHVSSRSIAQEQKIDLKTVLSHLSKGGFKKKLDVWVSHQLTPKNMMDRIAICEVLAKWNEIDPFLKRMVTEGKMDPIRQY
ncbi:histone-lysine N-methyltransferase SETMAR [Trichonephila clavipes]|nr:histone-lysine N-methyltransferase SETMAR [Trichonephila clavipes]